MKSSPPTVLFDHAPTLEGLKKLPANTKSRLLLARLAGIGATSPDALNKGNLMLTGDPYRLAYGYDADENEAVRSHLLGVPWTRLVNEGFLADSHGRGSFVITDEGKEVLEKGEDVGGGWQDGPNLNAFRERARKGFDLKVGNLYQGSIQSVHDLRDQYQNEGISTLAKYLRKTADSLTLNFQGVERAFVESYLQPFPEKPISRSGQASLLLAVTDTIDREVVRVKDLFILLASSFAGATSATSTPYLLQFDRWNETIKTRLNIEVELVKQDDNVLPTAQQNRAKQSPKNTWLPPDWKFERSLSEGGQGWAYLVRHTTEGGPLRVLKRLKNLNRTERFLGEIKALETLSHPGILSIIKAGEEDKKPYYIAEYCEKGDLSKWEPKNSTLLEKLKIFSEITDAVSAAHSKGIIHRDLKPFNILVRSSGAMVVGDFGLCIHLDDLDSRFTTLNEPVGPRNYIAPELEDGRCEDPEPSADVYSLGKLLYFILTAKSFSREKHRVLPFDLLQPEHGTVEAGLHFVYEILDKTIAADPKARYGDGSALHQALAKVIMKIENNANFLSLSVPQRCIYCRDGSYRMMQGTSPSQHTLKLICSNCGNFQEFINQNAISGDWWSSK